MKRRTAIAALSTALLAASASFAAGTNKTTDSGKEIAVLMPWVRAMPPGAPVAGGYLSIRNSGRREDRLLSVASPDADKVEMHEMSMDGGVMRMRMIDDGIAIAPGKTFELKPGGYHLMFINPKHVFAPGETVTATLRFERAGTREVRFEVRPMGASAPHR